MDTKDINELLKKQYNSHRKADLQINFDASKPVKAISSKVSDHTIKFTIRDSKGLPDFTKFLGCQPRTKTDGKAYPINPALIKNFDQLNVSLSKWLSESKENSAIFFENPFEAIKLSGVKIDRSDLKSLHEGFSERMKNLAVSPEVRNLNISVEYKPGELKTKPENNSNDAHNCNCK